MNIKLLPEHHFEFLSFKVGCTGLSGSKLVKLLNCWKSHAAAHSVKKGLRGLPISSSSTIWQRSMMQLSINSAIIEAELIAEIQS